MSGLFGHKSRSTSPEVYTGIQVSTSAYGQCIPLLYGRQRIPFNLIWYGGFVATPVNSNQGGKGGGGAQISSYDYKAAFMAALCVGPIVGVTQVFHDKALTTLASENLSISYGGATLMGSISGTTLTVSSLVSGSIVPLGGTITLVNAGAGGAIPQNTLVNSGTGPYTLSANCGTVPSQLMFVSPPIWSWLQANYPAQAIPYDHVAWVGTPLYDFGSSASMPNLTFETDALLGWNIGAGMYDASLARVLAHYLQDPVEGAGFLGTIAPLTGTTNSYEAYCGALGLFMSPYENTQRAANSFLKDIATSTNSEYVLSVGTLKVIPYADQAVSGTTADGTFWSYTPNLTPLFIFTDADYCPKAGDAPVRMTEKPLAECFNDVNLEYLNRANYYNTDMVNANDIRDIVVTGARRTMSTVSMHHITQTAVARMVAQLLLQASLHNRRMYEIDVRSPDYSLLEPMDIVAINDATLGLVNQDCWVLEVMDSAEDAITLKLLEIPGVSRSTPQYNWQSSQGYAANYATAPGSVLAPTIFLMPPGLGAAQVQPNTITVGVAVAPSAASVYWGGCNVYCSLDGGTTYVFVGRITSPARYGTITSSIPAGPADPDITTTVPVGLYDTALQLSTAVTHAEADANQTLALFDGGSTSEVFSYGAAALVSAGNYNLSYLRRGLYGTTNQAHTSGCVFIRLDGSIFQMPLDVGMSGQTVFFKFTSFNLWGQATETLSAVTAYSYQLPGFSVQGFAGVGQLQVVGNGALDTKGNYYKSLTSAAGADNAAVTQQSFSTCAISAAYAHAGPGINPLNGVAEIGLTQVQADTNHTFAGSYAMVASVGTWVIIESNIAMTNCGAVNIGDMALITFDGYVIRYYLNGDLMQTTGVGPSTLYAYANCFDPGTTLSQLAVGPYFVVTPSQFVTNNPGAVHISDTKIAKIANSAGWNAGALSEYSYNTMHFAAKTNNVNTVAPLGRCMFGLCTPDHARGVITGDYTKLDYAWYSDQNDWQIYENGTLIATVSTTASLSDVAWITCDQTNIRYYLNDPNNPVRTIAVSQTPLFGGVCLYDPGAVNAGLNSIAFGPGLSLQLNDTAELGANAATNTVVATGSTTALVTGSFTAACSVAVGPYPWAATIVVTATCEEDLINSLTSPANCTMSTCIHDSVSGFNFAQNQWTQLVPASSTLNSPVASEYTFSLAANTTATYSWGGFKGGGVGYTAEMVDPIIKAEVIKR